MHRNSLLLFKKHVVPIFGSGMKVLEIGPNAFPSDYRKSVSVDLEWETVDLYESPQLTYSNAGEYSFPVPDNHYDIVLSGQVMEHVKKIWVWVRELQRVCKVGGHVVTISPVSWPYHEAPVDCWRIYPEGMKALLEDTSLKIVHCEFESLECPQYQQHIPGRTLECISPELRKYYRIAGMLGYPVERSYDLVTIAEKEE